MVAIAVGVDAGLVAIAKGTSAPGSERRDRPG